jgi:hypothetical protein
MLGNYPVGRDDAAQLAALQLLAEIGSVPNPETCMDWPELLEGCLPKQVAVTRTNRDWEPDVLNRYRAMVGSPLQSTFTFEVTRGIQHKGPAHKASVNVLYATME